MTGKLRAVITLRVELENLTLIELHHLAVNGKLRLELDSVLGHFEINLISVNTTQTGIKLLGGRKNVV